jgi:ketosteroid isomerase-like protein
MDISERLAALEAMVQATEAAQEVSNIVASYALAAIARDEQRWVGLFTEDGMLVQARQCREHSGKAALTQYFRDNLASGKVTLLQTYNLLITVDRDMARGESLWTAQHNAPDGTIKPITGLYDDDFVKASNGWKIERRIIRDV